MKVNQRPTRHTSPRHDPILRAIQAACGVLAVVAVLVLGQLVHRDVAMAGLHCPAPDHAVWADSLGPWYWKGEALCGDSLTAGVTSR